jgi:hypothetical protein
MHAYKWWSAIGGFDQGRIETGVRDRHLGLRSWESLPVRNLCPAATPPTSPHTPVKFVKINMTGQHQQSGRDEVFASPSGAREPGTGDGSGALYADVVASLRDLTKVINQRLQFGPFRG